jgi:hypothetical protein
VSTIDVYAQGFERASVEGPLEMPDELVVHMRRSTVLDVRLLSPLDRSSVRARLILGAAEEPILGEQYARSVKAQLAVGDNLFLPYHLAEDGRAISVHTDRAGRIRLSGVKPGLPLWMRVEGLFGTPVLDKTAIPPLAEEERRELEVVLSRAPLTLSGVVLDRSGRPLSDARVGVHFSRSGEPYGSSSGQSQGVDEEARFSIGGIFSEEVDLDVQCFGYVPFRDQHFVVPQDGSTCEIRLDKGRDLQVILESAHGERLEGRVSVRREGMGYVFGKPVAPGEYVLQGLPEESLTIDATVYHTHYSLDVGPQDREARLVLPPLGQVEAIIGMPGEWGAESVSHFLVLVPAEESGLRERWQKLEPAQAQWPMQIVLDGVLPGSYRAIVKSEHTDPWTEPVYLESSTPVPIEVQADRTTRLQILH